MYNIFLMRNIFSLMILSFPTSNKTILVYWLLIIVCICANSYTTTQHTIHVASSTSATCHCRCGRESNLPHRSSVYVDPGPTWYMLNVLPCLSWIDKVSYVKKLKIKRKITPPLAYLPHLKPSFSPSSLRLQLPHLFQTLIFETIISFSLHFVLCSWALVQVSLSLSLFGFSCVLIFFLDVVLFFVFVFILAVIFMCSPVRPFRLQRHFQAHLSISLSFD